MKHGAVHLSAAALLVALALACGSSSDANDGSGGSTSGSGPSGGAGALEPEPGMYGTREELLAANSEMAVAQLGGTIYVLGGYPSSREVQTTVQAYDVAGDSWSLSVPLPIALHHPVVVESTACSTASVVSWRTRTATRATRPPTAPSRSILECESPLACRAGFCRQSLVVRNGLVCPRPDRNLERRIVARRRHIGTAAL